MDGDSSKTYSPSRLDTYRNCPRRYKYRYIDKVRRAGRSIEAHLGASVHAALEQLYKDIQHGKRPGEDEVLAAYEEAWEEGLREPVAVRDKRYTLEDWKTVGRECVSAYCRTNAPFDREKTVAVEARVGFPLDLPDPTGGPPGTVRIEGYMDRLALAPDGTFEIHDYKTGRTLPAQAEVDEDRQLAVYNIGVLRQWPDAKGVRLLWHYVRHGKSLVSTRTPERLKALKGELRELIAIIRADRAFEPVKSALCDWCDWRDICPLWKHAEAYARLPAQERRHESGVKLVDAYAGLDARKKVLRGEIAQLEAEQEELERRLVEYAQRRELRSVTGTDVAIDLHVKEDYRFPTRTQSPEKIERIEAALKAHPEVWREASRLDGKALMDGFKAGRWPSEVIRLIEGWMDKLIRHETLRTVRLHHKRRTEEE